MSNALTDEYKLDNVFILEAYDDLGEPISTGSCFSVGASIFFTSWHVVKNAYTLRIFQSRDDYLHQEFHAAKCVFYDKETDFAILSSDSLTTKSRIEIGIYKAELNDEIKAIGYAAEKSRLHFPITSKISNVFDFSTTYKYDFEFGKPAELDKANGLSGGPIFFKGYAIGLLALQTVGSALQAVSFHTIFERPSALEAIQSQGLIITDGDEISYDRPDHPESPFIVSIDCAASDPNIKGLDIGFDLGEWRSQNLIDQTLNWIEDYALTPKQKKALGHHNFKRIQSAKRNFQIGNPAAMADLFLHIAIRQNYKTIPIISNVITIDGESVFSCSHIVIYRGKVELWLGISAMEVSMEQTVKEAIRRVDSIIRSGGIQDRLVVILSELDPTWPYIKKLEKLSNSNLKLTDKIDKIIIPMFLSSNADLINNYDPSNFSNSFQKDIDECRERVAGAYNARIVPLINLRIFLFPVDNIHELHTKFVKEFEF